MVSLPSVRDYRCFAGGDIAATSFTATWTTDARILSRAVTFAQSPTGFAAFHRQLQANGVAPAQTLIVLEATGSYWVALAVTLHEAGYTVAVRDQGATASEYRQPALDVVTPHAIEHSVEPLRFRLADHLNKFLRVVINGRGAIFRQDVVLPF